MKTALLILSVLLSISTMAQDASQLTQQYLLEFTGYTEASDGGEYKIDEVSVWYSLMGPEGDVKGLPSCLSGCGGEARPDLRQGRGSGW